MRSRDSLTAAIWHSPNERQRVKHIAHVIYRSQPYHEKTDQAMTV